MIEIRSLHKQFGGKPAVTDLNLTIPAGGIYGRLGHNGAGKSTTLGMLLGHVRPDRGSIEIDGHDVRRHRSLALRRVGAIFETPCFYDYLSGERNLRMLCEYTAPVNEDRLREVVELVGLTDRIRDKVIAYSHGMRQRLALAQALLPDPALLILDEPTDGRDPEGIRSMLDMDRGLNERWWLTIIFSSHQLVEVERICTHVAVRRASREEERTRLPTTATRVTRMRMTAMAATSSMSVNAWRLGAWGCGWFGWSGRIS